MPWYVESNQVGGFIIYEAPPDATDWARGEPFETEIDAINHAMKICRDNITTARETLQTLRDRKRELSPTRRNTWQPERS